MEETKANLKRMPSRIGRYNNILISLPITENVIEIKRTIKKNINYNKLLDFTSIC